MDYEILVIDDDREMRDSLKQLLTSGGFKVTTEAQAKTALSRLDEFVPDAIICDVKMPGMDGLTFLSKIKPSNGAPVVMMSAHGDIPMAVQAIKDGAHSFIEKPFDPRQLLSTIENVAKHHRLSEREKRLKERLTELTGLDKVLIGETKKISVLKQDIIDFSESQANLLLVGETGTGKELAAQALHDLGPRTTKAFVTVNCAAIPAGKFEETIFGIEGGALGFLDQAEDGTLFLDEIHTMPLEFQTKILRVIENGEFCKLGSSKFQKSDIRILSASNEPLENVVDRGEFRSDLLYRVNTIMLNLPALRERQEDIELLFHHFSDHFAQIYNVKSPQITTEDLALLMSHPWPGNVRELKSVSERRILATRRGGGTVREALQLDENTEIPENLRGAVAAFERKLISKALAAHNGKMDNVADALGISRRTLNEKIVKLGLDKDKAIGQK